MSTASLSKQDASTERYRRWEQVLSDPELRDLPYKIETNRYGQIIMTPHKPVHSGYQRMMAELLRSHMPAGVIAPELAIVTEEGVKVADLAWMSHEVWTWIKTETAASRAPEICVEVLSDRNALPEIETKAALYFARGAKEVWVCDEGRMSFYVVGTALALDASRLAPHFPLQIDLRE